MYGALAYGQYQALIVPPNGVPSGLPGIVKAGTPR